ncbi:T9SS type A sorting domain-containing protein [Taibaiella koreensis]|uniref:T9SS type A sorting domain-containing protein n=1 Tax=Taibaiella koreensis TaxID=1268548 RepID=UPI000E5A0AC2|nr:T9SS type A sorting domain-containing protein [Taibaiella koreensis]
MQHLYFRLLLVLSGLFLIIHTTQAQVSVTATAGTMGPTSYTTLKSAFDAVNAGTHRGAVTILITGNTTETAMASLNASGSGSANYASVTVKPGTGASPTVSGNIGSGPVVRCNGSSNLTIDGSNNGSTSRNLTITNTNGTASNVMLVGSVGITPISNVTVKNTILINGTNSSTAVLVGDAGTVGVPGYFNNITFRNNDIRKAYIGLYLYAVVATGNGNNTLVTENSLDATGTDAIRLVGIYGQGLTGLTISNNSVGNFETASPEFDRAIWIATATTNTTISGNTVSGLRYSGTSTFAPIGINVSTGITSSNITVNDNIVSNLSSSGSGTTMGMFLYSAMSGVVVKANKVSNIKNTNTAGYGAAGMLMATTINSSDMKINNNFVWDVAGYGYTDYTSADNGNGIVVDGGGGIDIDFNTVVLNTDQTSTGGHRASCLLITANVNSSGTINLRNNILTNLQTVGNANSRLALSNLATTGSGVFGAINYNNYYSTSTNLSSTGTNASITNTLAQLQTSLGGNASSTVVQPVFLGPNDLHLSPANPGISNNGSPVSGITTDIDGQSRSVTTPDKGADEFTPCQTVTFSTQPVNAAICPGSDTSFRVVSGNGTLYQWQVNTGSGYTNITNNTIYGGATTATLTLTAAPSSYDGYSYRCVVNYFTGCTASNSNPATLTIIPPPVATISSGPTAFCPGGTVTLNANSGAFTYQWQRNGANIVPPATAASYNAGAIGNYTVVLRSNSTGCRDTSDPVTVTANPLINATQDLTICANQLPYTWNSQSIAAGGTAVATYTRPSLVTGCDSTTTLNLSINAVVTATQNITICANLLPYTWNGKTLTAGGTAVAKDTSLNVAGCDSITTLNLTVNPLLTATQNLTICQSQLPYTWNGLPVAAGGTAVATYTRASLVTGCDSTTTLNLTVTPNPNVSASPMPQSICSGSGTAITASSTTTGASLAWTVTQTGVSGASAGSGGTIAQTLTTTGAAIGQAIYAITATASGCGTTIRDTVTVRPLPATTVTPASQSLCSGAATSLALSSPVSGATFSWTISQTNVTGATAGSGATIAQNLTATTNANGTATYTIKASANGCTGSNTTATVTVTPVPANPGAITGPDAPCAGSTQTYSIPTATGATSYSWTLPAGWTGTSTTNSITVTVGSSNGGITVSPANTCGSSVTPATKAVTSTPVLTPTINISSNAPALLCSGTTVTYTATTTNGGTLPAYGWQVNGNPTTGTGNTFTYVPAAADTVRCVLTSNYPCVSANGIVSNMLIMQVTPSVTATLNIYVPENNVCSDIPVHFLATPGGGGTAPFYQWKVNNVINGSNSTSFTYTPADNDVVTCEMTSSALCVTPAKVISNMVPMSVTTVTHPAISISSSPASAVNGQPVTFNASVTEGSPGAQVTWYKNGVYVATAAGPSWTAVAGTDFNSASRIQALLRSFSPCADPDTVWSNTIKVSVGTSGIGNPGIPDNFKLYPNPANRTVNIEGLAAGDALSIYDALGHRVRREEVARNGVYQVDLSPLAQGMYWFRFENRKGQQWQIKVTKQ